MNLKLFFFIDANKTNLKNGFCIEPLSPAEKVSFSTHEVPPNQVLNLCKTIYNKTPKAYLVKIQGYSWNYTISLTIKSKENLINSLSNFKTLMFNFN